ncbi:MAG: hypothetical protein JRF59_07720 [Deltaproteobacteria bacterium]|nr:hypothetical protein [Deltaproteobacteria bacterium]MBW1922432.1 hypothetical protein [Deltaproteobacteria bacterium]MBW1949355.1 hypothetical protein [Deltaproteobacteria bacterium]MBW2007275.1 hypothetical protein [Deltaproteobacteria bacterium]MBW2101304.1 hypothetical protein [Deltaproteobacteria bacterium]
MRKKTGSRIWLWLALFLLLAALMGYFFWSEWRREEAPRQAGQGTLPPKAAQALSPQSPPTPTPEPGRSPRVEARIPWATDSEETDPCVRINNALREFFQYLEQADYIARLDLPRKPLAYFIRTLHRLEAHPPVPAGEGLSPAILSANVFHLYRALDRETLRLGAEILRQEEDNLEVILRMFFDWQTLGSRCPPRAFPRLSQETAYRYAGFFLNTVGGRAYLFRRAVPVRLLVSYYALCLIHEADKTGRNALGIDVRPFILPLMEEISRYTDFRYHEEYMRKLDEMDRYYRRRR